MTNEYKVAIEKHNEAIQKFQSAKYAYRYQLIGDDAYIAAMAEYKKATAEFDLAFDKEASCK